MDRREDAAQQGGAPPVRDRPSQGAPHTTAQPRDARARSPPASPIPRARVQMRERGGSTENDTLAAERKAQMNRVLFETRGTLGKPDWAVRRDQQREAEERRKEP